jgi:hypothetical protein
MKVKIAVTNGVIKESLPRTAHYCPVAIAFNALPDAKFASVGSTVTVFIKEIRYKANLPDDVVDAIKEYDRRGGGMKPFEFEIELQRSK